MESRRSGLYISLLVILGVITLGGSLWMSHQISAKDTGGGRFWIEWIGVRARLVDGYSPYNPIVTAEIQDQAGTLFNWAPGPKPSYISPLFSAIISLPFTLIPEATWAHTAWLAAQFAVMLLTVLAGTRLVGWKPTWWLFMLVSFFILLSLRNSMSWYEGSMMIWVSGLVVWTLLALQGKRYELAGVALALTMIQPQVVILWVVFVLVWAGSHRKWGMVAWFTGTLLILGIVAALLVPDWPIQYLRILWNYRDYFAPGTPGYAFSNWWPGLGRQMGWVLSAVVSLVLLVEWWLSLRRDYRWFLWTACLTMTVSLWIGIPVNPDAHVMLNLPLLLILSMFAQRWRRGGIWVAITGVVVVFVWEWGLIYATLGEVGSTMRLGLIFPLPLILLIGLFWVRWWTIHPKRLLIDELRASETY